MTVCNFRASRAGTFFMSNDHVPAVPVVCGKGENLHLLLHHSGLDKDCDIAGKSAGIWGEGSSP